MGPTFQFLDPGGGSDETPVVIGANEGTMVLTLALAAAIGLIGFAGLSEANAASRLYYRHAAERKGYPYARYHG